jgi:signal transduction histidine kinase
MGLRHRSIRLRVGILIIVPVLCLIALYGFVVSITLGNALTEAHAKTLKDQLLTPLGTFETQVYKERALAVLLLATPNSTQLAAALGAQEDGTKQALTALDDALGSPTVMSGTSGQEQQAISTLNRATNRLSAVRADVGDSSITMTQALADYTAIVDDANNVIKGILDDQPNVPLVTQALSVISLDQVAQTALEESNLLSGEIARRSFPLPDRTFFAQLAAERSTGYAETVPQLQSDYRKLVSKAVPPALSTGVASLESAVINTPWRHGPPSAIMSAPPTLEGYAAALDGAVTTIGVDLSNQSQQSANDEFAELFLAGGLGLLGILVSIGLSLYIGRRVIRQLRNLRESALTLATQKLPTVMRQLRDGEAVDLSEYASASDTSTGDEIEQVQLAFNMVQQSAVQAAVDEARLRRGISDVFRNLAGRSQSLLHRQLTLLDGMERRATEPDELEDLFRLDHLTTRMRRHAEGLIILSGEAPARGWRQPVPLVDVLRAAVAEVEDYTRIRVFSRTKSAIAGHAVADVIHLVAELAENATVFSPPNTPVRIQGDVVGRGIAVEIEDRGLGISGDRLAELNADLANPRQFDLSDSDRLGLFITGQLARRHGITVTLQPSVYGGTTAIVLLPSELIIDESLFVPDRALESASPGGLPAGRHAALAGAERGLLVAGNGDGGMIASDALTGFIAGDEPILLTDSVLPQRTPLAQRGLQYSAPDATVSDAATPEPFADTGAEVDAVQTDAVQTDAQTAAYGPFGSPTAADSGGWSLGSAHGADWRPPPDRSADSGGRSSEVGRGADQPGEASDAPISTTEPGELGLPVRVRQASLAPQLRDSRPAMTPSPTPSEDTTSSPESARSTMSALQRGWRLGRAEADGALPKRTADAGPGYDVFRKSAAAKPADAETNEAEQDVTDEH